MIKTALESHWVNYGQKEGRYASPQILAERFLWPIHEEQWRRWMAFDSGDADGKEMARLAFLSELQRTLLSADFFDRDETIRTSSFDAKFYGRWYKDLSQLDSDQLQKHWLSHGKKEGRFSCFRDLAQSKGCEVEELPAAFNHAGYLKMNEDELEDVSTDAYSLALHFLELGKNKGLSYFFDPFFYQSYYADLSGIADLEGLYKHYREFGLLEGRCPNLEALLIKQNRKSLLSRVRTTASLEEIKQWNGHLGPVNFTQMIAQVIQREPMQRTRLFETDLENALFYADLAVWLHDAGNEDKSIKTYFTSLSFYPVLKVFEKLGMQYAQSKRVFLAAAFLKEALSKGSERIDLSNEFLNTARPVSDFEDVQLVIKANPKLNVEAQIIQRANNLWPVINAENKVRACYDDRDGVEQSVAHYAETVRGQWRNFYTRFSAGNPVRASLNKQRVLIIGDFHINQCIRYRIRQKELQLTQAGFETESIAWNADKKKLIQNVFVHDIIIFYRCPALPSLLQVVEKARSLGKCCIYEIDDHIFSALYPPPIESYASQIDEDQYTDLLRSFPLYAEMAKACHFGIASTQPIQRYLAKWVESGECFLHRNALDEHTILRGKKHTNAKSSIDIFYGSATLAHNTDFTESLLPVLVELLRKYDKLRVVIAGHLDLGDLVPSDVYSKVKRIPYMDDIGAYLELLGKADINIAVLDENEVNNSKSELKWIEAGCMGIPSVVSKTANYEDVIQEGKTGFIAANPAEWKEKLEKLVLDPDLRGEMGEAARSTIVERYSVDAMATNIHSIIDKCIESYKTLPHE